MKRFAEEFGVDVDVESAGTQGYHIGEPPDKRMQLAAEARGYDLIGTARRVEPQDLDPTRFDLVLAMDTEIFARLQQMAAGPNTHIRLFGDYLEDEWPNDVPDPYYGEEEGFGDVLDMLEEGCPVILQTLMGEDIFKGEFDEQ